MLQPRVDSETNALIFTPVPSAPALFPLLPEDELETPPLPREHPKWVKDALAVSQRARALLARLRPIAVRVMTFWDHHVRGIAVGDRRLTVDISGSYRME